MRLGAALRLYRASAGKSSRGMAEEIGIFPATYSRIETNRGDVNVQSLMKVLVWLAQDDSATPVVPAGVDPDLGGDDEAES